MSWQAHSPLLPKTKQNKKKGEFNSFPISSVDTIASHIPNGKWSPTCFYNSQDAFQHPTEQNTSREKRGSWGGGGGYKETQYSKAFHDCPGYDLQFAASRKGNNASQEGGYSQDIKIPSRRPRSSVSIDPKALCVAELEIQRLFS